MSCFAHVLRLNSLSLMWVRLLSSVPPAHQNVPESCPEGFVTQSVAHGVHRAVHITQPVTKSPESLRDAVLTEGIDQHHDVVGQPRHHERQQNGTEGPSRFLLICLFFILALVNLRFGPQGKPFGQRRVFYGHGYTLSVG